MKSINLFITLIIVSVIFLNVFFYVDATSHLENLTESLFYSNLYLFPLISFVLLAGVVFIFVRLLKLKEAENQKLQKTNRRFEAVMNNFNFYIFAGRIYTNEIIYANKLMKNKFQVEENEAYNKNKFDIEKYCNIPAFTKENIHGEATYAKEFEENGNWYLTQSKIIDWLDEKAVLHIISDITERKKIQQEKEKNSGAFKQILESLPVAVAVIDKNYAIKQYNTALCELFNIESEENIKEQSIKDVIKLQKFRNAEAKETQEKDENKYYFIDKNNNVKIVFVREQKVDLGDDIAFINSFIDITLIEEARKGEAMANKSKSMFLANMSHEIRTPLNGIIGMADVMLGLQLEEEQRQHVTIIKKSGDLLLSIINDILDYSKIEAGKMELEEIPFKLREEMDFTVETFAFKAKEKNIKLYVDFNQDVPNKVIGDPFRLRQIFTNLIGNAVKFTDGGEIKITCEFIRESYGTIILLFSVIDTGIGIPKEKLQKIFASFSQADGSTTRKYGGTGLGTTISKQLVEMMEGEIWADSPSGLSDDPKKPGSKFSFTIELFNNEKLHKDIETQSIKTIKDLNALVVDNKGEFESVIYKNLKELGIQTDLVTTGEEAVSTLKSEFIKNRRHRFVFIENTKEFNGMEICRTLDNFDITENHIFVILSSNDLPGNYIKTKRMQIDNYIIKPYEAREIFEIIEAHFSQIKITTSDKIKTETLDENLAILIAEDNLINQKVAKTIFKTIGYEIDIASNGNEVLNKVKNKEYDVIFMDFMMPIKDGLQATVELREKKYKMPIIAMTASVTEEDRNTAMKVGMDDYISKPILISSVKNILMKWFS